jgi:hypothetical protein
METSILFSNIVVSNSFLSMLEVFPRYTFSLNLSDSTLEYTHCVLLIVVYIFFSIEY